MTSWNHNYEDDTAAGVGGCAAAGDPTGPGVGVDAAGDVGAADRVLFWLLVLGFRRPEICY